MTFKAKKIYNNLAEEIYSEQTKSEKTISFGIFFVILLTLGLSIIMLSIQYSVNNQAELINFKEMNQ